MKYGVANTPPATSERFMKLRLEIFDAFGWSGLLGFDRFIKGPLSRMIDILRAFS